MLVSHLNTMVQDWDIEELSLLFETALDEQYWASEEITMMVQPSHLSLNIASKLSWLAVYRSREFREKTPPFHD